jgi:hypothetical protein
MKLLIPTYNEATSTIPNVVSTQLTVGESDRYQEPAKQKRPLRLPFQMRLLAVAALAFTAAIPLTNNRLNQESRAD